MRYPVVFLDAGGTLLGPRESFGQVYSSVFAEFGLKRSAAEFEQAIHLVWAEMNAAFPPGVDRYTEFEGGENGYWLAFLRQTVERCSGESLGDRLAITALGRLQERFGSAEAWRVFDDVPPALSALRERGVRLTVVSNWDSRLPAVLKILDLDHWFERVVVSHFEQVEKPSAELFARALEQMSVDAGSVLHVGDSPGLDGTGATAAGIDWLWVDRLSESPASGAVADFSTLCEIAERGRR